MADDGIKVLAIASGGGHWVQLLRLRPAWDGCDIAYATVHPDSAADVPGARFFSFEDVSRKNWWRVPAVAWQIARLLATVRPDVLVTTGAAPPLLAIILARLSGTRTLWVDSIANSEVLSSSGKVARRVAHRTVTQWPALSAPDLPCWGSVL